MDEGVDEAVGVREEEGDGEGVAESVGVALGGMQATPGAALRTRP